MENFNKKLYLRDMYEDEYFPGFLVDKVKTLLADVVVFLETGERNMGKIQEKFDDMTDRINELQQEFWDNGSDIETGARDSIGETVRHIIAHFRLSDYDSEDALRNRDW